MGQNSRQKRAATQRRQHHPGRHANPQRAPAPGPAGPIPKQDQLAAASHHLRKLAREFLGVFSLGARLEPLLTLPDDVVDKVVDGLLAEVLHSAFSSGWSPLDLVEMNRRQGGINARLLLDCIVAATASHPEPVIDPRWAAQLSQFGGAVWWDRRRPYLGQWAARERCSREQSLVEVITLLARLMRYPRIEQVLPPPGSPLAARRASASDPAQEKVLAKVRALLAKAESTDFVDEADALSAKAQELMSRHALDRALLEHQRGTGQYATVRRIWLDAPYVVAKASLIEAVARANRCRSVVAERLGHSTVIGDEVDLQLVEVLATSLLLQATRVMVSAGSHTSLNGVSRTRSYRQSFLLAYAHRIGERLSAANAAGASAQDAGALLPVLSARSKAVDDFIEQSFPQLVSKRLSSGNFAGWGAGRVAADLVRLDVRDALGQAG